MLSQVLSCNVCSPCCGYFPSQILSFFVECVSLLLFHSLLHAPSSSQQCKVSFPLLHLYLCPMHPLHSLGQFMLLSSFSISLFPLSPALLLCPVLFFTVCAFSSFLVHFLSLFHHPSVMDAIFLSFSLAFFLLGIFTLSLSHALSQVLFHHAFSFSFVCFPAMFALSPAVHIYNICFPLFSCALSALSFILLTISLSPPILHTSSKALPVTHVYLWCPLSFMLSLPLSHASAFLTYCVQFHLLCTVSLDLWNLLSITPAHCLFLLHSIFLYSHFFLFLLLVPPQIHPLPNS